MMLRDPIKNPEQLHELYEYIVSRTGELARQDLAPNDPILAILAPIVILSQLLIDKGDETASKHQATLHEGLRRAADAISALLKTIAVSARGIDDGLTKIDDGTTSLADCVQSQTTAIRALNTTLVGIQAQLQTANANQNLLFAALCDTNEQFKQAFIARRKHG